MTKIIGLLIWLFVIWLMHKLMRFGPPTVPTLSIRERQELRRQAHEKPYNPRFPYSPKNKHRNPF